ncbi:lipoamide acyltransferase component of branched-chain alpha-keto acid dehydrogenase complex, mitochondrial [Monomorium pharaonis]|uniref:lipoamide acyltransferase component of branched-chain alpha-keto acid dehydrogenase complex, mitochondrial n=1 Tax=Monomorium pharaonis TaxID=307658 RepID=UPI001745C4FC|nr:lipoamide acyltransferase component of branched-chain alpha-keto acid dehydrogenase complex, mitochondrial [Monomorium pharaonis]
MNQTARKMMAFSWRLLSAARLAERSRDPIRRLLSVSSFRFGQVVPFKLTDIGEGIRDVTVKEWFVKPGDRVAEFDEICEVASDKASVTITSRYAGLIKTLHYNVDDVALVGTALCDIELENDSGDGTADKDHAGETVKNTENQTTGNSETREIGEDAAESEISTSREGKVLTTPAVRRIARENNVNLNDVIATGKNGRVLKEDLLAHLQKISAGAKAETDVPLSTNVSGKPIPLKGYTKQMYKTMTKSLSIPHFVYSDECNVDQMVHYRNELKGDMKKRGVTLTFMPFFIKAASRALEECPKLNAWLNEETLYVLDNHNIGIAMDTPDGLVVPNIKNVQLLNVFEIARELNRLQECGSRSSIPLADLTDTTFSLSNIGVIGGTYTKPVIVPPQVMIGAFGKAQKLPRFDNLGNIVPASIMSVSWSADHRVIDGVTVAKFSNLWKHYVENPIHLMSGV